MAYPVFQMYLLMNLLVILKHSKSYLINQKNMIRKNKEKAIKNKNVSTHNVKKFYYTVSLQQEKDLSKKCNDRTETSRSFKSNIQVMYIGTKSSFV